MAYKMKGFSKHQTADLTKKPVGPKAKKKEPKKETYKAPTDYHDEYRKGKKGKGFDTRKINPSYEDPLKIQALHREGLTPGSQKMSKIAKEKAKSKKYKKYSDLEKHDDDR